METSKHELPQARRPKLSELNLSIGKRTRLHRLLYRYGPANGTLLLLPIDQGLEHGPRDFFANPESADPNYQLRLAKDGGFSGIAFQIGLAEKYMQAYAGEVPLILKLNGRTEIPTDVPPFSGQMATVEDAVRLGADAVGYTLYVGSPAQDEDFIQFAGIREEAERYGMPVIMWAYPRGDAVEAKGGRDSLWAVDYAARVACELGADVVKLNFPVVDRASMERSPAPYNQLQIGEADAVRRVVQSAGRTLVLFSGGTRISDADLLSRVRMMMEGGATGLIFGRNFWQRPYDDAMRIVGEVKKIMLQPAP